jgi:hypothetical protein
MKKRMLIILALGISFAPAVFAGSFDSGMGEDRVLPSAAVDCPLARGADKNVGSDSSDSNSDKGSNSTSAQAKAD